MADREDGTGSEAVRKDGTGFESHGKEDGTGYGLHRKVEWVLSLI